MAKIGEGDARWIVADREDGTNVRPGYATDQCGQAACHTGTECAIHAFDRFKV